MPKRILTGTVTSAAGDKTAVVAVATRKTHPLYKKKYTRTKKYYIHDEKNVCNKGDVISFIESTPYSKLKRWELKEVLEAVSGDES